MTDQDVLDLLRSEGPLTRARIARCCNISKPTASVLVEGLLTAGLIREDGHAPTARRGRPGQLLSFEPRFGYVMGLDVGGTSTRARLADLAGVPVAELREATASCSADELIGQIVRLRDALLTQHEHARDRIKAVVVGTPGVVDPKTQRVQYAPNLPLLEQPDFLDKLAGRWKVPVRLANDVNLAALGEARFEQRSAVPDFVFVSIGTGLGFGLVRDGQVYEGCGGRAGELGYLPYPPGCTTTVETFVSGPGIARVHRHLGGSGQAQDAFDQADRQQGPGRQAIDRFLSDLAWLLAILSTLLDPHEIVLGGGVGVRCGPYLPRLNDALGQFSPIRPNLAISKLGGRAGLAGAVCQALDDCRPIERLRRGGKMNQI